MKKLILFLILFGVVYPVMAQSERVTNGDFSNGLNGWNIQGNPDVYFVVDDIESADHQKLVMNYTGIPNSRISQQIYVRDRERYRLSFTWEQVSGYPTFNARLTGVWSDNINTWNRYPTGFGGTFVEFFYHYGADGWATLSFAPVDDGIILLDNVSFVCVDGCRTIPTAYPSPTPAPSKTPNPLATPQLTPPSVSPSREPNCGVYTCGSVVLDFPQLPGLNSPTPIPDGVGGNGSGGTPIAVITPLTGRGTQTPSVVIDTDTGGTGGIGGDLDNPTDAYGNNISPESLGVLIEEDNSDLFFRYVKGLTTASFGPFSPLVAVALTLFSFFMLLLVLEIAIPLFVIVIGVIRKGLSLLADFIPF